MIIKTFILHWCVQDYKIINLKNILIVKFDQDRHNLKNVILESLLQPIVPYLSSENSVNLAYQAPIREKNT